MSPRKDISGQRFGRLVAVEPLGGDREGKLLWLCRCDCGAIARVTGKSLRVGNNTSCGCGKAERFRTHGLSNRPEYGVWEYMLRRCRSPKCIDFENYGGRGITVCERWQKFENFYADMGPRPEGKYSIDRIDNNGNYEPGNCRWATDIEQKHNFRSNVIISAFGKTGPIVEFIEEGSRSSRYAMVLARIHKGWDPRASFDRTPG